MLNKFKSLAVLLGLLAGLYSQGANAVVSVTATQASGTPGQNVDVTLNLSANGIGDQVDLSQISAYTFNLLWNPAVLDLNGYSSSVPLSGAMFTGGAGSAVIDWIDESFVNPVSFAGGLAITANFKILPTAAYGPAQIQFGDGLSESVLFDNTNLFGFSAVTSGGQMQINVVAVPEPGEASMLLAGLGLMAMVVGRRKHWRAA